VVAYFSGRGRDRAIWFNYGSRLSKYRSPVQKSMNVKKTAEGIIFHVDGDMEKSLLKCVMDSVSQKGEVFVEVQARLNSSNGGTFYVLKGEVPEFSSHLEDFMGGCVTKEEGSHGERFGPRDMAQCLIVSCREFSPEAAEGSIGVEK